MILAIDQGTTGTTCLVFDREGRIAGRAYSEFEQHFPRPGWVEHDADEIWDVTRRVGGRGARRRRRSRARTSPAIGITNQRETVVAWDPRVGRAGPQRARLAGPPHRRAAATSCARRATTDLVRERTGLVIDPYFSGTKIEWLLRNVDAAARRGLRHDRLLAGLQAHRPARHRSTRTPRGRCCSTSASCAGTPSSASCSASTPPRLPEPRPLGGGLRDDRRVRRRGAGGRDRRRPAGGAVRPGLPPARDGEEHLRHRQLRPAQHRRRGAGSRRGAADDGRLGARSPRPTTRSRRRCSSPAPPCSGCATGSA